MSSPHFSAEIVERAKREPGADPGFFLGGGALVSCSTSTPINHIVLFFFLQNTSCIRKPQVISGRGAQPLHPPPRSAPASARENLPTREKVTRGVSPSRVGWFSRAPTFRSLYYPWGKVGTTPSRCCTTIRRSQNNNKKKVESCWPKSLTATTLNTRGINMQQQVQTVATCNTQYCNVRSC